MAAWDEAGRQAGKERKSKERGGEKVASEMGKVYRAEHDKTVGLGGSSISLLIGYCLSHPVIAFTA